MNETIGGMVLVGALVAAVIGSIVQAVILRAAVAMYNRLSGANKSTDYDEDGIPYAKSADTFEGVPEPTMPQAMGICFVIVILNSVISMIARGSVSAEPMDLGTVLAIRIGGTAFSMLVMAAILTSALPTTFGRAVVVTLCHALISILIAVPIILFAMYVFKFGLF